MKIKFETTLLIIFVISVISLMLIGMYADNLRKERDNKCIKAGYEKAGFDKTTNSFFCFKITEKGVLEKNYLIKLNIY